MKTSKIVSGLMALSMAVLSMGMVASAADSVQVTIGKDTQAAGAAFSVDVDLASVPSGGLSSIDFAVNYDASIIDVTDVTLGAAGNTGAAAQEGDLGDTLFSWYDTGSQIVIIWATGLTDTNYWVKDGTFLTISGTVDADAKAGAVCKLEGSAVDRDAYPGGAANSDIVFSAVGADATVDYTAAFTNGSVTVAGGTTSTDVDWGNVDCSEGATVMDRVTIADTVLLARLAAEDATADVSEQGKLNADCKYDGVLDVSDTIAVLQFLAGKIDYSQLGNQ